LGQVLGAERETVTKWEDVKDVQVNVSGTVDVEGYEVSFNGMNGGSGKMIKYVHTPLSITIVLLGIDLLC
jgi:hypothetical protein